MCSTDVIFKHVNAIFFFIMHNVISLFISIHVYIHRHPISFSLQFKSFTFLYNSYNPSLTFTFLHSFVNPFCRTFHQFISALYLGFWLGTLYVFSISEYLFLAPYLYKESNEIRNSFHILSWKCFSVRHTSIFLMITQLHVSLAWLSFLTFQRNIGYIVWFPLKLMKIYYAKTEK